MFDRSAALIVGAGETEFHRNPLLTPMGYVAEAMRLALKDAGVGMADVDGLAVTCFELPPDNTATVAEHLGLTVNWVFQGVYGGASAIISLCQAARAIANGDAEVVVVVAAGARNVAGHRDGLLTFNKPMRDYVLSYGFGGENGYFGLVERRHAFEYGTRREALGKIAVTQRSHAVLNDNALFREPLSLQDYLHARVIADPIRLYDCVLPCAGADAVVLMSAERARRKGGPFVRIAGDGQNHNVVPTDVVALVQGWSQFSDSMFEAASIGREDIDMVQLYDDYPIMSVIQLEDMGFCDKGDGGRFVERTDLSISGTLPMNTGGGQLSAGQPGAAGGFLGTIEAYRQLTGQCGRRQVAGARHALVSGFGMTAYGKGVSTSAAILERTDK